MIGFVFNLKANMKKSNYANDSDTSTVISQLHNASDKDVRTFARSANINIHLIKSTIRTVAELLNKLHAIGLCHGDLSSRNVLVDQDKRVSCHSPKATFQLILFLTHMMTFLLTHMMIHTYM